MKNNLIKLAACLIGVFLSPHFASAGIIYQDDFNYSANTQLRGLAVPSSETPLNNSIYTLTAGSSFYDSTTVANGSGVASIGADIGLGLKFVTTGGISSPQSVTLSLTFQTWSLWSGVPEATAETLDYFSVGNVSLGFWSAETGGSFAGVAVDIYGNIKLTMGGQTPLATAATTLQEWNTLSYTVDTATGTITSLLFNGSAVSGDFENYSLFTSSQLAYVGFAGRGNDSWQTGNLSNFTVSAVPEPGAVALIGFASVLLFTKLRSRSREIS